MKPLHVHQDAEIFKKNDNDTTSNAASRSFDNNHLPQLPLEKQLCEEEDTSSWSFRRLVGGPILQSLSIFLYVSSWVANGESLQGIVNGTFGGIPYNKPAFITWLDYSIFTIGFVLVWPWIRQNYGSFQSYLDFWRGSLDLWQIVTACIGLSFLLTAAHILYVIGLQKISVASSNAAYQVQAACTLSLSVLVFGGHFQTMEIIGIFLSLLGIAAIVIPPLFLVADTSSNANSTTNNNNKDALIGTVSTIASAALWGFYQVAWRALYERKTTKQRTQATADTIFTLAVIGLANLCVGWTVLPLLDWIGFETFQPPPASMAGVLTVNAMIEYAFNVLCVIAIHMTSPVVTSLTAPLTIPLSWWSDSLLYQTPISTTSGGGWGLLGAGLVVVGVSLMELKPQKVTFLVPTIVGGDNQQEIVSKPSSTTALPLLEAEMKDYVTFFAS